MSWITRGEAADDLVNELALFDVEPDVVSGKGTLTKVYSGKYQGQDVFLKVSSRERWKVLLPRLCLARAWCSSVDLEARNLLRLREAGITVIPILGYGTRYTLGLPVCGVMLSAAVEGVSLEDALMSDDPARIGLAAGYGRIAAMLHKLGGYEPLRAKDFMVNNEELILLDREKPLLSPGWREARAMTSLERAWFRNHRSGLRLTSPLTSAWVAGYCGEAGLSGANADQVSEIVSRFCAD
ncbi:hypothetical protein Y5S_02453 [Alcanivorax nanhaiticus]|uniref:Aminoglycoside phosphotransferase domain-containing protein n=1 Tax=Alcanivorax nanhaiticus TaxID=1177154 RepID=A0A095TPR7_9GAMM|nr:hypothetical protein [Alcanivorax nanhaiticus]KGD64398.1 hypothetical protein Y5S_02453 [Alcanivorax nanhaiticus]